MNPQNLTLDDQQESQPAEPRRRTIYDASAGEIFFKSLIAGFAMGLGRAVASLILFVLLTGIFITYVQPAFDQWIMEMTKSLTPPSLNSLPTQQFDVQSIMDSLKK